MRSVVFRFENVSAFAVALGEAHGGSLTLPDGETVLDGEWVLAIFEIGSHRRATAAAARGVRAAGDPHLAFERRDWDRLSSFVAAKSEHVRAAKPVSGIGPTSSSKIAAAAPAALADTGENETAPASVMESARVPFGARVLVVDDEGRAREEVRQALVDVGLVVEVAASAAEAALRMQETAFDALVVDFHTHDMEPRGFVRSLRSDPLRAPLPVLFLSHRPSSRDAVVAFASGADDFLPRPFRASELGARVFGLLRRARFGGLGSRAGAGSGGSAP